MLKPRLALIKASTTNGHLDLAHSGALTSLMARRTMRAFRKIVSVLVALCVAVAPLASFAATPAKASIEHAVSKDHMPDCPGMKAKPSSPAEKQKPSCPHCKDGVCTSDVCKLKCHKVFGELPRDLEQRHFTPARLGIIATPDFRYVQIRPPLPPPRA